MPPKKKPAVAAPEVRPAAGPEPEVKLVELEFGLNKITVGTVPLTRIVKRGENYRRMSAAQKETLQASVARLGFQTFLVVVDNGDGTFGLIDGHHRLEELERLGSPTAPVVVLPAGTSENAADLGMFSFNVSAQVLDDKFAQRIKDLLERGADPDEIRKMATIDQGFMEGLLAAIGSADEPPPDEVPSEGTGESKGKKPKAPPQIKILVILAHNDGDDPAGPMTIQALVATYLTTVIGAEAREVLSAEGIQVNEVEPAFVENDMGLIEYLAGDGGDEEEDPS